MQAMGEIRASTVLPARRTPVTLHTSDGLSLVGELALPAEALLVRADPVQLLRALRNLVDNACKFTPSGGAIQISVQQDEGRAVVAVTDSGISALWETLWTSSLSSSASMSLSTFWAVSASTGTVLVGR